MLGCYQVHSNKETIYNYAESELFIYLRSYSSFKHLGAACTLHLAFAIALL